LTVIKEIDEQLDKAYHHLLTKNFPLEKLTKEEIDYLTYIYCCGNIGSRDAEVHETERYKEIMKKLEGK